MPPEELSLNKETGRNKETGLLQSIMLKNCEQCGEKLENAGHNARFCSEKCRAELYAVKYRERRLEWQRNYFQKLREEEARELVACLICGKKFIQVGSHIVSRHGITAREYREHFGLDVKKGTLPPDYRERKARDARDNEMPEMLFIVGKRTRFKKGQKGLGKYTRSEQTKKRLSKLYTLKKSLRNEKQSK